MRSLTTVISILVTLGAIPAPGQVSVLTHHNDNTRIGANLQETVLTVANVNNANFGKLAFRLVDGDIYAQPLIVSVKGPDGKAKSVAIVATENNSVYAFDADNVTQNSNAQLWQTNLAPAISYSQLYKDIGFGGCSDTTLQIGITSTPAVMLTSNQPTPSGVVFVTAKSNNGGNYVYNLYSLDLATGSQLGKISIQGQVSGQGIGSTGSGANAKIVFSPLYQFNRPALALNGNTLYIAFGGHCDTGPYHGWVFAYDVSNPKAPKRVAVFCVTPNGTGAHNENNQYVEGLGGIWMSGEGPAIDASGNVYVATGNGTWNGTTDFSDSVLKLKLDGGQLRLLDWFTPNNPPNDQLTLKNDDYDLGSGGVALIPNSHLAVAGGKEGILYLIDQNNLGKTAGPVQSFLITHPPIFDQRLGYNIHGAPVIWPRNGEMFIYLMGEEDNLKQLKLVPDATTAGWRFDPEGPFKISKEVAPYPGFPAPPQYPPTRKAAILMPGGFLEVSADGTKDGTGILWALMPLADNANHQVVRGILRAFNASDVSTGEIWDSEATGRTDDSLGQFAKYCPPVVANGKVYVATFQEETMSSTGAHIKTPNGDQPALVIYGPLPANAATPAP